MIRLLAVLGVILAACAQPAPGNACAPDSGTDRISITAQGRAFLAVIDRDLIALTGTAYCEQRPAQRNALSLPVRVGDAAIRVSVQPIPNTFNACRSLSKGMALRERSAQGLLYSDGAVDEGTLACLAHRDGPLTVSCRVQAPTCAVWNVRALDPGCHAWISAEVPKGRVANIRSVMATIDRAITLVPACDRQAKAEKGEVWKT